jgi:hypothetical protein
MLTTIATILILIFLSLCGIHIYWAFGGKWGMDAVVPTKVNQQKVINPGLISTLLVAVGLFFFAVVVFLNAFKPDFAPDIIHNYGLWVIASIFTLRAIGEFNYVGFFKRHRDTKFGRNDTRYYSPLCLLIGVLTVLLALHK